MFINQVAVKPQLVEIVIDSPEIVDTYGETISFWMRDHLDLQTYFDFYKYQTDENRSNLIDLMKKIILTAEGLPAIGPEEELPVDITLEALFKINEQVGKSRTKSSIQKTGTQPE